MGFQRSVSLNFGTEGTFDNGIAVIEDRFDLLLPSRHSFSCLLVAIPAIVASAATAMHHSNATARSAAYDKHGSDRIVASAMKAADDFAGRFA